ncbi:hypothetical protein GC102_21450 [Paenibacillus sp. LMG 31460]|uniref:Uncharacterized protein n=1 Tax=Paenibacillus germinis TaxID=2654979 RepID=A0ABX1Z8R3_9BACL|nr:hypothetical protein [Paenibacillus germinis]NOU88306.1 hypothetical protein [Paenibacillus germinis]
MLKKSVNLLFCLGGKCTSVNRMHGGTNSIQGGRSGGGKPAEAALAAQEPAEFSIYLWTMPQTEFDFIAEQAKV